VAIQCRSKKPENRAKTPFNLKMIKKLSDYENPNISGKINVTIATQTA
jgi:hypothetical protein